MAETHRVSNTANPNSVIIERLTNLQGDMVEIKALIRSIEIKAAELEKHFYQDAAQLSEQSREVNRRIDVHEKRMDTIETSIQAIKDLITPLITISKIWTAIAGVLGGAILIFLFSLLTHQVTIGVP